MPDVPLMIMPNYLPLQPPSAVGADGYMGWNAWPLGISGAALDSRMTTELDQFYLYALGSAPYMMSISPWCAVEFSITPLTARFYRRVDSS